MKFVRNQEFSSSIVVLAFFPFSLKNGQIDSSFAIVVKKAWIQIYLWRPFLFKNLFDNIWGTENFAWKKVWLRVEFNGVKIIFLLFS